MFSKRDLDGMLVSADENRRYLSGFTGSAGYLVISGNDAVLGTDFRYVEQAGNQSPEYRIERLAGGSDWLPKLASEMGISRIGFESQDLTVHTHAAFQKAIEGAGNGGLTMVETSDMVDGMRATKY